MKMVPESRPCIPPSPEFIGRKATHKSLVAPLAGALLLGLAGVPPVPAAAEGGRIPVTESSFKCITDMVKVRHFFVDNLLGKRSETVAVAEKGGIYPPGSVVQLIPGEVMVKHEKGFNPITKDWEFFELDVSKEGSKIRRRGFADVNNRFGGNCFACHVKARPEFDFICETEHGCDPIPVTRRMIAALQRTDPRCPQNGPVSDDDAKALEELGEALKALSQKAGQAGSETK